MTLPLRPDPVPSGGLAAGDTAQLARAERALGRLGEALSASPLAGAWLQRMALEDAVQWARWAGEPLDRRDLLAALAGAPLDPEAVPGRTLEEAAGIPARVLRPDPGLGAAAAAALRAGPGVAGLAAWLADDRAGPDARPGRWMAAGAALEGAAGAPLAGVAAAWFRLRETRCDLRSALSAIAAAAEDGRRALRAVEAEWSAGIAALGFRRGQSRTAAALHVLLARPLLSPASLARALGWRPGGQIPGALGGAGRREGWISLRGARHLLDQLVEARIAEEVSGRRSWRLYALAGAASPSLALRPDGAGRRTPGAPPGTRTVPATGVPEVPPLPAPLPPPIDWAQAFADLVEGPMQEVDAATRRVAARMRDFLSRMDEDPGADYDDP
jgi:hypothetical protein